MKKEESWKVVVHVVKVFTSHWSNRCICCFIFSVSSYKLKLTLSLFSKIIQFSAKFLWLSEIQITNSCGNIAEILRKNCCFLKTRNKLLTCLSHNNNEFSQNSNLIFVIKLSKGNKTYSFHASVLSEMLANN